ncbi:uncharacterized protein [Ptychodera flava]|uniref:uncharacterized protein n=1 Tax=Ptychodera flava TaxID=63121 RepID=UPI00396A7B4B
MFSKAIRVSERHTNSKIGIILFCLILTLTICLAASAEEFYGGHVDHNASGDDNGVEQEIVNFDEGVPSEALLEEPPIRNPGTSNIFKDCWPNVSCKGRCGFRPEPLVRMEDPDDVYFLGQDHLNCFCDEKCYTYGDCCYDYDNECIQHGQFYLKTMQGVNENNNNTATSNTQNSNLPPSYDFPLDDIPLDDIPLDDTLSDDSAFRCLTVVEYSLNPLWLRNKCGPGWRDKYVEDLCIHPDLSKDSLSTIPVRAADGNTYRNVFCAQCNHQRDVEFWRAKASCTAPAPPNIKDDPIALSHYIQSKCTVYFLGPSEKVPQICVRAISVCDSQYSEDHILVRQCKSSYNAVVVVPGEYHLSVYKNTHCALCNNISWSDIKCPVWNERETPVGPVREIAPEGRLLILESELNKTESVDPTVTDRVTNASTREDGETGHPTLDDLDDNKPPPSESDKMDSSVMSYAVLINLNFDGQVTVRYDSETGYLVPVYATCKEGEVYDPWRGLCRDVYCAEGYHLEGVKCVPYPTGASYSRTRPYNTSIEFETVNLSLTLTFRLNINIDCIPERRELEQSFGSFVSTKLMNTTRKETANIHVGVIDGELTKVNEAGMNVTYNSSSSTANCSISDLSVNGRFMFTVILTMTDVVWDINENNFKWAVQKLTMLIINGGTVTFEYKGNTLEVSLVQVSQNSSNSDPIQSLVSYSCPSGNLRYYSTPDVTIFPVDDSVGLYVNATNTTYEPGTFLLTSYEAADGNGTAANFTAVVCEHLPYIAQENCPRIRLNSSEYMVFPNQSIEYAGQIYDHNEYESVGEGVVEICMDHPDMTEMFTHLYDFPLAYTILTVTFTAISLVFLLVTFVTYAKFKELRTVPGLSIMSLITSLFFAQLLFLVGIDRTEIYQVCATIAVLLHYLFLSNFFWMNILAYDVFKTFAVKKPVLNIRSTKSQFLRYSAYGWGSPILIIAPCVVLNFCECVDFIFGYGYFICWIANPYSLLFAFIVPVAIVLIINVIFYSCAVFHMRATKKEVRKSQVQRGQNSAAVYIKMTTVMGFAWIFGLVACFTNLDFFWVLFIIFNGLQGCFIGITFVCNKRVFNLYRKKYPKNCFVRIRTFCGQLCQSKELRRTSTASDAPLAVIEVQLSQEDYERNVAVQTTAGTHENKVVNLDDDVFV